MRVTQRMMVDRMVQYTNQTMERLAKLQSLGAAERKFVNFSDNPSAAAASLSLRSTLNSSASYLETARLTDEWMTASEVALEKLESIASRYLVKVRGAATDTLGEDERSTVAAELEAARQDAITTANSRHQDSYIFAGFKIKTQPFVIDPDDPTGLTVLYQGDDRTIQRSIAPNQLIDVNVDGLYDAAGNKVYTKDIFLNFFNNLQQAADALRSDDTAAIAAAADALEESLTQLSELRGINGTRLSHVNNTIGYIEDTQLALQKSLANNENINLAEVITQMRQQEIVYQAILEVSSRTMATANLFQYLG